MPKYPQYMNLQNKNNVAILGIAMTCFAVNCSAMTLGNARGAVFIGQPLGLTAAVELESNELASSLCFGADVFYGDSRLQNSQVRVRSEKLATANSAQVRVETTVLVDEPVVTVYLRAGCDQKTTRRYVLLADPAMDVVASPLASAASARPLVSVLADGSAAITGSVQGAVAATRASKPDKALPKAVAVAPALAAARATGSLKTSPRKGPRLQLLALDLSVEHEPTLHFTSELVLGGVEDLQKRAEAAAIWRALNATPQDIAGAQSRQQAMEADIKGLEKATTQNRQTLEAVTARLEDAQSQRYFNPLVYGLFGLLVLTAGLLVWAFRRLRDENSVDERSWSDDSDAAVIARASAVAPMVFEGFNLNVKPSPDAVQVPVARRSSKVVDIDLDLPKPAINIDIAGTRSHGHVDFAHSMSTSLRAVNTHEMLDVRQQAEFFMTLGQHDEAVALLKDSIESSNESNPLVYLDLLRIFHSLARKKDFDYYRASFNTLFSGRVPPFAEFDQSGKGLESYPEVCNSIETLWPTVQVLDFIEDCLNRPEDDHQVQRFDLEAFRDLLLLHAIAQRLGAESDSGLMPFSTAKHTADSLPSAGDGRANVSSVSAPDGLHPVSAIDTSENGNSLDFDLTEPPGNMIEFETTDLLAAEPSIAPER